MIMTSARPAARTRAAKGQPAAGEAGV